MPEAVREKELARLPVELQRERIWLAEASLLPYEDKTEVLGSIAIGQLVCVPSGEQLPFRQYYQDRQSVAVLHRLPESCFSVPYLRPGALAVIASVAVTARERLLDSDDGKSFMRASRATNIQYSVTSMVRTRIYQKELTARNALAYDGDSAHLFGVAFDVDHSGFYIQHKSGETLPVNGLQNANMYDDSPIHAFQASLEEAAKREALAFITELPTGRGCWHVAVNPELAV